MLFRSLAFLKSFGLDLNVGKIVADAWFGPIQHTSKETPGVRSFQNFNWDHPSQGFEANTYYHNFSTTNKMGTKVSANIGLAGLTDFFTSQGWDMQLYFAKKTLTVSQDLPEMPFLGKQRATIEASHFAGVNFSFKIEISATKNTVRAGFGTASAEFSLERRE